MTLLASGPLGVGAATKKATSALAAAAAGGDIPPRAGGPQGLPGLNPGNLYSPGPSSGGGSGTPSPSPSPGSGGGSSGSSGGSGSSAPAPPSYDFTTDPILQQVQAAMAQADANAQADALQAREQLLLQYGDPQLAAAILGSSDPMVQAAGQNQESTLAMLGRGYKQNLRNYDTTLDPSLVFSGARIRGENQLGQNYQDALAKAAAAIQSGLQGITTNLNSRLASDQQQVLQALSDAYTRAINQALANQTAGG